MTRPPAVAIDLDGVLGDTRALWGDWLASVSALLEVDADELPPDREEAIAALDRGGGNWRALLQRYGEERAAVYLRRDPATSDALRVLVAAGSSIGIFTDAPEELARIALTYLGADRRVSAIETGPGALERLLSTLGHDCRVVRTRAELLALVEPDRAPVDRSVAPPHS